MTVRIAPQQTIEQAPGDIGPVHTHAAALLRKLAEREPSDLPVLTAYLDLRPPGDAADPAIRATRVVVRDRLREVLDGLPRHGPLHDSVAPDAAALEDLIDEWAGRGERGLAVFACHGDGLHEILPSWAPFNARVEVAPLPVLLPLARWLDHEPALLALVDTNSLRLFIAQPGRLVELPGTDDDPDAYTQKNTGSPDEANFQRHVEDHRDQFARRAAKRIGHAFDREGIERVFLAGDETAIPHLQGALPGNISDRVRDILRLERRAPLDEIETKVLPAIESAEVADARDAADRLMGAIGARGLGVGGLDPTRQAVSVGAALELLLDAAIGEGGPAEPAGQAAMELITEADANQLVALAARTDARITFVPAHAGLRELGGVGALLRYRP